MACEQRSIAETPAYRYTVGDVNVISLTMAMIGSVVFDVTNVRIAWFGSYRPIKDLIVLKESVEHSAAQVTLHPLWTGSTTPVSKMAYKFCFSESWKSGR